MQRVSFFSLQIFRFAILVLLLTFMAFLYRLVFLVTYADFSSLKMYWGDVLFSFVQGFRFDILVILYCLIVLLALAVLATIFIKYQAIFIKISKIWAYIAVSIFLMLLIGDFYYYRFFNSHYNILIFGIIHDETQAVLKSIWIDFPVIRILIFMSLLLIALYWCINKIYVSAFFYKLAQNKSTKYLFIIIILLAAFFLRGRLGMFPLRMEDGYFSKSQFVNTLTMNGIFTFKAAYTDYKKNKLGTNINNMLAEEGFADEKELISKYTGVSKNSIVNDPLDYLLTETSVDTVLAAKRPHVVVLQMEGMGLNFMNLDSDDFQILGCLKEELPYCVVYKKFLPFMEGTIFSLEGLLTSNVMVPMSLTPYLTQRNLASVTTPFQNAGYTSTFITGAKRAWRNLDTYIPAQGFDNYESKENIMHDIPTAQEQEWGAYDGYMLEQIWNRLDTATSPQFIFGMSITNHTPYSLPKGYRVSNMIMNEQIKGKLLQNEKACFNAFSTYRYACDCLGNFIAKVRQSPIADNVIIAITGDHSIKGIIKLSENDILQKHGVPLILYVPPKLIANKVIDTSYWGAHKDIFPTLFNLALSNAKYYKLGCDLLSTHAANNCAIDVPIAVINDKGAVTTFNKKHYYWHSNSTLYPVEDDQQLDSLYDDFRVWRAVLKYVTLRSIK